LDGRLNAVEAELVVEMIRNMVKPKKYFVGFERYKASLQCKAKILKDQQRFVNRNVELVGRQQLCFRERLVSQKLLEIFLAHSEYVKSFNIFSTVLLMASIYKTNHYKMSLFEIIVVTSTKLT